MPEPNSAELETGDMNLPFSPDNNMEQYCSNRAEVKIKNVDRFFQNIPNLHYIMVAGNYTKEVSEVMAAENINVIGPLDSNVF